MLDCPSVKTPTLAEIIYEYQASIHFRALAPSSQRVYLISLKKFSTFLETPVIHISRSQILRHVDRFVDRPATANAVVALWGVLMGFALDREYIEHSPAQRIYRLKGGEHRPWTDAEIAFALVHLPDSMRRVIVLALYTAQRCGDLASMKWSNYNGQGISLKQQKTNQSLYIPCHPLLQRELTIWRNERKASTLLERNGIPWTPEHLSNTMRKHIKQHPELNGLVLHGIRKTAAVRLSEAGCTTHEIAAITGHASLSMIARYTAAAEQRRLSASAIGKLLAKELG